MDLKLGETIWRKVKKGYADEYEWSDNYMLLDDLLKMGAVPVEDEECGCRQCECVCHKAMIPSKECVCYKKPEIKLPEKIEKFEICYSAAEKEWYHDMFVLSAKINQIINYLAANK